MLKYKIYYFGKNKINWKKTNEIGYIFETVQWDTIEQLLEKIKIILDDINNSDPKKINNLLYYENLGSDHCDGISELLQKYITSGKIFMGTTIYNKTVDAHISIRITYGFKKIVNIFPFDRAIKVCDQTVYDTVLRDNKTITVIFDPTAPLKDC
jgi:hypothetical protein